MATEIERIVRMVEKTFDKQPWFGNSILETLSGINPGTSNLRHGTTHSIIELILHMTFWRLYVTKRLQGDNSFRITDELNFPKPESWESAIDNLKVSQQALVEALKTFPEARLGDLVPESPYKYTFYTLIHGIIQHDIYHLGQIAYIKKSFD